MPKKDDLKDALNDPNPDGSTPPEGDDAKPDWLNPDAEDSSLDAVNALIEEAQIQPQTSPEVEEVYEELAGWSSQFSDPRRELAALERVRDGLKRVPTDKLKPGQFAAVKERIAFLKRGLNIK